MVEWWSPLTGGWVVMSRKEPGRFWGAVRILDLGAGCTGEFCLCKSIKLYRYGRCSLMHVYYTPRK